jgi:hypothetical protein
MAERTSTLFCINHGFLTMLYINRVLALRRKSYGLSCVPPIAQAEKTPQGRNLLSIPVGTSYLCRLGSAAACFSLRCCTNFAKACISHLNNPLCSYRFVRIPLYELDDQLL